MNTSLSTLHSHHLTPNTPLSSVHSQNSTLNIYFLTPNRYGKKHECENNVCVKFKLFESNICQIWRIFFAVYCSNVVPIWRLLWHFLAILVLCFFVVVFFSIVEQFIWRFCVFVGKVYFNTNLVNVKKILQNHLFTLC